MADRIVTAEEAQQERQRVAAREAAATPTRQADETEEGGRYLVNDELVNAAGEPLKKKRGD